MIWIFLISRYFWVCYFVPMALWAFWYRPSPFDDWNDKPLKILVNNQGWSLEGALFCQNPQMGFCKEIPMSPRIGIIIAIGLWSGIIPSHLVEIVVISCVCRSKAHVFSILEKTPYMIWILISKIFFGSKFWTLEFLWAKCKLICVYCISRLCFVISKICKF